MNPSPFRAFELQAIQHLLGTELSAAWLGKLETEATQVSYEHTVCGYFVTVAHPMLPAGRTVFSEPPVVGTAEDVDVGFLVFVESGELMLECHAWGTKEVPADFRNQSVKVVLGEGVNRGVQGASVA